MIEQFEQCGCAKRGHMVAGSIGASYLRTTNSTSFSVAKAGSLDSSWRCVGVLTHLAQPRRTRRFCIGILAVWAVLREAHLTTRLACPTRPSAPTARSAITLGRSGPSTLTLAQLAFCVKEKNLVDTLTEPNIGYLLQVFRSYRYCADIAIGR